MSLTFILLLILGIVAIIQGVIHKEFVGSTFWFLLAFWVWLVFGALAGHLAL